LKVSRPRVNDITRFKSICFAHKQIKRERKIVSTLVVRERNQKHIPGKQTNLFLFFLSTAAGLTKISKLRQLLQREMIAAIKPKYCTL
jgi:hypothetical protein